MFLKMSTMSSPIYQCKLHEEKDEIEQLLMDIDDLDETNLGVNITWQFSNNQVQLEFMK